MDSRDVNKLLTALEKATGIPDKDEIRRKIQEEEIGDLISTMQARDYELDDDDKYFLTSYRDQLKSHKENSRRIKLIKENYSEVERIFNDLNSEIKTALGESVELEKISKALGDKKLLKKAKRDESEVKELKKKLSQLILMKEEMEDLESRLETETEHFDNIQHALSQRLALVNSTISESTEDDGMTEKNASDGIVLRKGMELLSSTTGYTLVIDAEPSSTIMSAVNAAIDSSMSERDKAEAASSRINDIIDQPGSDSENNARKSRQKSPDGKIYLSDVWADGEGVCKEIAATLHLVYQKLGIHSRYMRGGYSGARHAWVKVRADGGTWLADPTHDTFQDYSSGTPHSEGDNVVRIPDKYI
jgi:thiol-disulfide isomerase/thioredoxin